MGRFVKRIEEPPQQEEEAMEKLTGKAAFKKWYYDFKPSADVLVDELIWEYFHREFPREAVTKLAETYLANAASNGRIVSSYIPLVPAMEFCAMLERLWNGDQEAGASDLLERSVAENASGYLVCPTCEESGEVGIDECCSIDCEIPSHREPCPDCKPKPQKCFRCGVVNSDESTISCKRRYADGTDATGRGQIGRHRFVDQRKGQRRVEQPRIFKSPGSDDLWFVLKEEGIKLILYPNLRDGKDRRETKKEKP